MMKKSNNEKLSKVKNDNDDTFTQNPQSKSNIIVSVRCRPLTSKELEFSNIETIRCKDKKQIIVLDPIEYNGPEDIFKGRSREQQYQFDHVFNQVTTQEEVYRETTEILIQGVIDGYNATVFAYGASGAGKTYTMLGSGESIDSAGVMPRSLSDLFKIIDKSKTTNVEYRLNLSYLEVYNETIRDLLSDTDKALSLREDPYYGCQVVGLSEILVTSATDVFKLLSKGNLNRTIEATNHNETSSRSHGILQILVESKDKTDDINPKVVLGKFVLVDLAGSERSSTTKNTGLRLIEGGNINKSLLALGNCINGLVEASEKGTKNFIPWRDSKLTRILKDSLGGNSRISMIANISPSIKSLEDTLNTLKYANRAKNIKVMIKQNVQEVNYHIEKYDEVVKKLKEEIEELKDKLNKQVVLPRIGDNVENVSQIEEVQKHINSHFTQEVQVRRGILKEEDNINNLNFKIHELEYEAYQLSGDKAKEGKLKELNDQIVKLNKDLDNSNNRLAEMYKQQDILMRKRRDIQLKISGFSKDPLGKNLIISYRYYISLLENMTLEEKKNTNQNNIKIKDFQISKLTNQIQIRDQLIHQATEELRKKGGGKLDFNTNNSSIKGIEEIKSDAYKVLPLLTSHYPKPQSEHLAKNQNNANANKKRNISFSLEEHNPGNLSKRGIRNAPTRERGNSPNTIATQSSLDYSSYRNPNISKEPRKFKTKTTDIREHMKNNNISSIKLAFINNNYPNSKVFFSNKNLKPANDAISFDINNFQSNDVVNSSGNDSANNSMLERDLDKKSRQYLRYAGNNRARSNPYLR